MLNITEVKLDLSNSEMVKEHYNKLSEQYRIIKIMMSQ